MSPVPPPRAEDIFDGLDANKDGGIVWKELEANIGKTDPDKAAQLMEMADKNQDDKITWDEFIIIRSTTTNLL